MRFGIVAALAALLSLFGAQAASAAVTEFALPTTSSAPSGITTGVDGNLWVVQSNASRVARVTPAGAVTEFVLPAGREPTDIAANAGRLWFTERGGDRIGRLDPSAPDIQASITEFIVPGAGSQPSGITAAADGNVWFTEAGGNEIGRITPGGAIVEFVVPGAGSSPAGITAGPDGALWFTQAGSNQIGRITTAGVVTNEFTAALPGPPTRLGAIAPGPDGALWYVDSGLDQVRRITTAGAHSQFPAPAGSTLGGIASGPDGNLWLTSARSSKVARMTTAGEVSEYTLPTASSGPTAIASGPDGALWFTERLANQVGRITTDTAPDPPPAPPAPPAAPTATPGTGDQPGPAAPAVQPRLVLVAFQATPARPRAGRRVRVRFAVTDAADIVLQVKKGRAAARTVARKRVGRAGVSAIAWNGKLGRRRAGRGTYDLIVRATKDGRSVSSRLRVRLR